MTEEREAVAVLPLPGVWDVIDFRTEQSARVARGLISTSGLGDRLQALMEERVAAWERLRAVTVWIGGEPATLVALSWPMEVPPAAAATLRTGSADGDVVLVEHPDGYRTVRPARPTAVAGALAVDYWLQRPGSDRVLQLEFAVLESSDEPDLVGYLDLLATGATWNEAGDL